MLVIQCLPSLCCWELPHVCLFPAGDPLRFHAHYIAQCWAPEDPIPLQDLVSAGRLGTSVRKTLLLCSPQPDGKVVYTSLQWASLQ
jgi:tRNA-splicing endonuclease subunit Sen34